MPPSSPPYSPLAAGAGVGAEHEDVLEPLSTSWGRSVPSWRVDVDALEVAVEFEVHVAEAAAAQHDHDRRGPDDDEGHAAAPARRPAAFAAARVCLLLRSSVMVSRSCRCRYRYPLRWSREAEALSPSCSDGEALEGSHNVPMFRAHKPWRQPERVVRVRDRGAHLRSSGAGARQRAESRPGAEAPGRLSAVRCCRTSVVAVAVARTGVVFWIWSRNSAFDFVCFILSRSSSIACCWSSACSTRRSFQTTASSSLAEQDLFLTGARTRRRPPPGRCACRRASGRA